MNDRVRDFSFVVKAEPCEEHEPEPGTNLEFLGRAGCGHARTRDLAPEVVSFKGLQLVLRIAAKKHHARKRAIASTKVCDMQLVAQVYLAAGFERGRLQRYRYVHRHIDRPLRRSGFGGLSFGCGLRGLG